MRPALAVVIMLASVGCGGSPSTPSAPSAPSAPGSGARARRHVHPLRHGFRVEPDRPAADRRRDGGNCRIHVWRHQHASDDRCEWPVCIQRSDAAPLSRPRQQDRLRHVGRGQSRLPGKISQPGFRADAHRFGSAAVDRDDRTIEWEHRWRHLDGHHRHRIQVGLDHHLRRRARHRLCRQQHDSLCDRARGMPRASSMWSCRGPAASRRRERADSPTRRRSRSISTARGSGMRWRIRPSARRSGRSIRTWTCASPSRTTW